MGATVSARGLRRLLGAPIGTVDFCVEEGGHLDLITNAAVDHVRAISRLHTPQAQFGMLLYSAASKLTHLSRLIQPHILTGFAERLTAALQMGVQSLLTLQKLTHSQRVMIRLPTGEGGLGLVSANEVLMPAFISSHGSAIRFLKKSGWGESADLACTLIGKSSLRQQVDEYNAQLSEAQPKVRGKLIDMERPDIWPTQKQISSIVHRITANDLQQDLGRTDPATAGWFTSMRLSGSGSFLRVIPSSYVYKVSSECFRIQLSMRIMAPIPALQHPSMKCVCGYKGPALATGVHYLTQCPAITLSTTRHNSVVRILGRMMKALGWDVRTGENAAWVPKRPDLRPFDLLYKVEPVDKWTGVDVGISDPTRFGLAHKGTTYLQSGQAASNMVQRKKTVLLDYIRKYGPLKVPVIHQPISFEATGGAGVAASKLLASIYSASQEHKLPPPKGYWTWSAQTFAAHWQQRLSFECSKFAAQQALLGARAIANAEVGAMADPAL
jgi:hypothetical protein